MKEVHVNGMLMALVRVCDLKVDHSYQRALDEKAAKKIADGWEPSLFGVPTVSLRQNGDLYLIDGQTRCEALRMLERGEEIVAVDLRKGMTLEQEAKLFWHLNTYRRKVAAYDNFRARLIAGERFASEVNAVVTQAHLHLSPTAGKCAVAAVCAMERVHRRYGNLETVLNILRAWSAGSGHSAVCYDQKLIAHVGAFLWFFPTANPQSLASRLSDLAPEGVIARVKADQRAFRDESSLLAAVDVLLSIYNKRNPHRLTRDDRRGGGAQ